MPVERIELPTFGLQNRCSTAELNRRIVLLQKLKLPLLRTLACTAGAHSALEARQSL